MSAIHRVDDIYSMDAYKFFGFAKNLIAYKGAVRFEAENEAEEERKNNDPERRKPVKDSNQWYLERKKAQTPSSEPGSTDHDPTIDPSIAQFMERGTG